MQIPGKTAAEVGAALNRSLDAVTPCGVVAPNGGLSLE